MRALSLFSGIGGFDLALEAAGVTVVAQSEIDPFCRKVLAKRFTGVRQLGDVTKVKGEDIGPIDLIVGGFPCQDVSVAGKRAGLAGQRSGLFWEIHRLAAELRPRWLLLENVPGLLSSNGGEDVAAILRALAELDYGYAVRVLDAQYFGLAQRRRRVFMVCCIGDGGRAGQVLFESESCPRNPAPSRETGARPAYSLTASVRGTGDGHGNAWNRDYIAATLNSGGNNGGFRTKPGEHLVSMTLMGKGNDSQDPSLQTYVTHALTGEGHDASEDGTGRGTPLPTGAMGVRRLMAVECERIQGFPDGWTCLHDHPQQCDCPDSARYRALGNAVAVPVIRWILDRLVAVDAERVEAAA